jgi:hypothetical protein
LQTVKAQTAEFVYVPSHVIFRIFLEGKVRLLAFITTLFLGLPQALALMPLPLPISDPTQMIKAICADPKTTDDERSDIISRSPEDAVSCMGEDWVYGNPETLKVSTGGLDVDVDVDARRMRFIDPTGKLQTWLISPGIGGVTTTLCKKCTATLIGEFEGPYRAEGGDYRVQDESKDYIGAPMPWAVFYLKDYGWAIHGTYAVGQLGYPASHGCVRISVANAYRFNTWVSANNDASVKINVHGTGVASIPARPRVRRAPAPVPDVAPPPYARPMPPGYYGFGGGYGRLY